MPLGPRCDACPLCQSPSPINNLMGDGPVPCDVMFVGKAPAAKEEMELRPLVGETGHLFSELLTEANLTRQQVRVENAIRCRLPKDDKDPPAACIEACRIHLAEAIRETKPKVIVALGGVALQSLLGISGIMKLRGRSLRAKVVAGIELDEPVTVFCMLMPASLFRRWEDWPLVTEDFRKLGRLLHENWQEGELGDYRVVKTPQDLFELVSYLLKQPFFAFDLETTSFDFWDFNLRPDCNILCMSFSAQEGTGFVVPLLRQNAQPYWTPGEEEYVRKCLNHLFLSSTPKWAQNGIFDINFLKSNGFEFNLDSFLFDTMLAHHTLQENIGHGLDSLIGTYTNMPLYSYELTKWEQENQAIITYADYPDEVLWMYSGADADATVRVGNALLQQLSTEMTARRQPGGVWQPYPLIEFFNGVVMPLNHALIDIEYAGVAVDPDYINKLQKIELAREQELTQKLHKLAGKEFNPGSPQQLQGVLFNPPHPPSDPSWNGEGVNRKPYHPGFGFPISKRSKITGDPSTDEEVLDSLEQQTRHPMLDLLSQFRKCRKKISTYLAGRDGKKGMLKFIVGESGRVHASWKQHTVVTGRLATEKPAIHNIPNPEKDPEYAEIRGVFTAQEGWWLVQADYSQLELRIVAHIAGEATMLKAFEEGKDIHRWTAAEISNIPYDQVTKAQRKRAKDIQFGVIYGKGEFTLSKDLGVSVQEAIEFLNQYFQRFSGLANYFEDAKRQLHERGYITNVFGRKRRLYGYQYLSSANIGRYSSDDYFLRQCRMKVAEMERQTVNFGIQSAGSELLSQATARIHRGLRNRVSRLVISHHDALVAETHPDELFAVAALVKGEMERSVPELGNNSFPVDLHVGRHWGGKDPITKQVLEDIKGGELGVCA